MITYKYKAKDENGKILSGTLQANDEADLHVRLKQDKKYLISAKAESHKSTAKRIRADRVADFARNISKLVGAGVSLVRALRIISEDETIRPQEKEVYSNLLKQVRSGATLSEAMREQGDAFPALFINMFQSAETSGNLDQTASQLAVYYEKDYRLNQKIKSAMTYPKILTCLIIGVVAVIMGYVIPQFQDLFAQMDHLPLPTVILLGISDVVVNQWYILILFGIILFMIYKIVMGIPKMRLLRDKLEVKMPKIGQLRKVVYTARFARTLSSLYAAGIPILNCLQISKRTIGNSYIESQFDAVIADVKSGASLSEAIQKIDGFTRKLSATILVGEETGELDSMLVSTADQMEYESQIAVDKLVAMLEPIMIVVMAVVVGFIIISVIQPIYGSYQSISTNY